MPIAALAVLDAADLVETIVLILRCNFTMIYLVANPNNGSHVARCSTNVIALLKLGVAKLFIDQN